MEPCGQGLGAGAEFGKGELGNLSAFGLEADRDPVRPGLHPVVQDGIDPAIGDLGDPVHGKMGGIARGADGGERRLRVGERLAEKLAEAIRDPRRRLRLEQLRTIFQHRLDAGGRLGHVEDEVELGRALVEPLASNDQAIRLADRGRGVLPDEHGLEDRAVSGRAIGDDVLDDRLKGKGRMGDGLDQFLARATAESAEIGALGNVEAQSERVGEEADDLLGSRQAAAGRHRADGEGALAGETRKEEPIGGKEYREGRDTEAARDRMKAARLAFGQREAKDPPAPIRRVRTRAVCGKLDEFGQIGEAGAPEGLKRGRVPFFARCRDGCRIVHIAAIEGGKAAKRPGLCAGPIGVREIAGDDRHRPAVRHRVMGGEKKDVPARRDAEERCPHKRAAMDRKGFQGGGKSCGESRFGIGIARQIDDCKWRLARLVDGHERLAVPFDEARAQAFMARNERRESGAEARLVERAVEVDPRGEDIGASRRVELIQEPQPTLARTERQRLAAIDARDRDRGRGRHGGRRAASVDQPGEIAEPCGAQKIAGRKAGGPLTEPRQHAHGKKRVAANGEKVGVGRKVSRRKTQNLAPDLGDEAFGRRQSMNGRFEVRLSACPGSAACRRRQFRRPVDRGKSASVDLAIDAERQARKGDEGLGHHIVGKLFKKARAQGRAVDRSARLGHHEGGKAQGSRDVLCDDGGLRDRREALQRLLDLAGLDAEAAQLDLVVGPAAIVEETVGPPAHEIAGPVEAARLAGDFDKGRLGQVAPTEIAARKPRPAGEEHAYSAGRDGVQRFVENEGARIGDRGADRNGALAEPSELIEPGSGRDDGGFGRAIGVPQADGLRGALKPALNGGGLCRLSAEDHMAQAPRDVRERRLVRHQRVPEGGGQVENGDPLGIEIGEEGARIDRQSLVSKRQAGAGGQRGVDFFKARIEAGRSKLQDAVVGADAEFAGEP